MGSSRLGWFLDSFLRVVLFSNTMYAFLSYGRLISHLASEHFHLHLDNVVSWNHHKSQVSRSHIQRDRLIGRASSRFGALLRGRLSVFVRMRQDDILVLVIKSLAKDGG